MTFELPQSDVIAVEYVGTAQRSSVSEQQKDVLRQALGAIFPTTRTFVDAQELPSGTVAEGIYVRCLQCDSNVDLSGNSVQVVPLEGKTHSEQSGKKHFKVFLSSSSKNNPTWLMELGKRKTLWYPAFKWEKLSEGNRLEASHFVANTCTEDISCPQVSLFSSKKEAFAHFSSFLGRRIELSKTRELLRKENAISFERLPFLPDVRAQSQVRATYAHKDSNLRIRMNARSLRNGTFGEIVPVEVSAPSFSFQKTRTLDAKVVGEGEVEIVR